MYRNEGLNEPAELWTTFDVIISGNWYISFIPDLLRRLRVGSPNSRFSVLNYLSGR